MTQNATTRQRIKEARLARGWSLMHLSRMTGIHPSTLSQLENGHRSAWSGYLCKIALAFGMEPDELRGERQAARG